MLTTNRVLAAALAAGALLLLGVTPASARAAAPRQAAPGSTQDFYGTGWSLLYQGALGNATAAADSAANSAGYPSSGCTQVNQWVSYTLARPIRWNAEVELQCTAAA
ncbi:hypothetical protein [Kitasatospora viridis]|uniref:Uncharacterized protein n=1 Tax=Kitasatospora viridis TaxID=281105 RepID=A0A561UAQ1_9ACTN|nr:hypothetical protein [Kitasatospora viridis]TWF96434.1 hypothetical protein FHX73_11206 [Kitasatospora viridis]